jgi:hypothetical protein
VDQIICPICVLSSTRFTAHALWSAIDQWTRSLANTLTALCDMESRDPECYSGVVKYLSTLQPVQVKDLPFHSFCRSCLTDGIQWFVNPGIFPEEVPIVKAFYEVHRITNVSRGVNKRKDISFLTFAGHSHPHA